MGGEVERTDSNESVGQVLSTVGDAVGDMVTGIPSPIRKNALKAFGRLCTAAVEYPVALLEDAIEEHHAASRARVKLIETSASQMAEQMRTDPEYARVAVAKFGYKILRERVNIDRISNVAAEELKSEMPPTSNDKEPEAPPISEDWLNAFEEEAAKMSSDQMQRMFGRILAGEIKRPTSYSVKTIKLMAQLDNRAAALFRLLCSLSISMRATWPCPQPILDVRAVSMGSAGSNSLQSYGLSFDSLNILQEYGLIIADYNSYMDYRGSIASNGEVILPITHQNKQWAFVPKDTTKPLGEFKVHGVALSRSGRELLSIIDIESTDVYTSALVKFFDNQGMKFIPVNIAPSRPGAEEVGQEPA